MNVKLLEEKGNTVKILMEGTNHAFVNALRRQIMSGIPVLAVEDVHIYQNNSVLFDEMLAHRLAMIPLKMGSGYKQGDKVKLVLEKEGPGMVYSKDIKSTDPKIEAADSNVPIIKLDEAQTIRVEMDALVNLGREHAKWQPAIASYTELPIIVPEKGGKGKSYKADVLEMLVDENQRDIISKKGEKIEYDRNNFMFVVESHGNMSPKELFMEAVRQLEEKSKELKKELKNLS